MVLIRVLLCLQLVSCAKISYLAGQGIGQVSLLTKARPNEEVLKNIKVSKKHKEKIKRIQVFKKYFYNYWDKKEQSIYSKTHILKNEAVTYLVIASKFNQVKAKKECFIIMGCFPYLGFFEKEKALKYAKELEADSYMTHVRPVYAYSTLGYFTDPILSSFFYYNDFDLAELIFHELFHTIFFIKDDVDFNENLANYFGRKMAYEFFGNRSPEVLKHIRRRKNSSRLNKEISDLAKEYQKRIKLNPPIDLKSANSELEKFSRSEFHPRIQKVCDELEVESCYPLKRKWNNASFAALLTYQKHGDKIGALRKKLGLNLKDYFKKIVEYHESYQDSNSEKEFSEYLWENTSSL